METTAGDGICVPIVYCKDILWNKTEEYCGQNTSLIVTKMKMSNAEWSEKFRNKIAPLKLWATVGIAV